MTVPIIILGILVGPWLFAKAWNRLSQQLISSTSAGLWGLTFAFVFFGIGHFVQTQGMVEMLPRWLPHRVELIYATGVLEWMLAVAIQIRRWRITSSWLCIAVLVVFFSANVYAATNAVGLGGHKWGPSYLLIRAPLQLILIGWAYWFGVRRHTDEHF